MSSIDGSIKITIRKITFFDEFETSSRRNLFRRIYCYMYVRHMRDFYAHSRYATSEIRRIAASFASILKKYRPMESKYISFRRSRSFVNVFRIFFSFFLPILYISPKVTEKDKYLRIDKKNYLLVLVILT